MTGHFLPVYILVFLIFTEFHSIIHFMKTALNPFIRKLFFLFFLIIVVSFSNLYAQPGLPKKQEINITFKVVNQKREPLSFATITIINRKDSLQIIKQSADSNGIAIFTLIKGGQYSINISSVNYQAIDKGINISGNQTIFGFTAEPLSKTLGEVTVTSKKPLMRQEDVAAATRRLLEGA